MIEQACPARQPPKPIILFSYNLTQNTHRNPFFRQAAVRLSKKITTEHTLLTMSRPQQQSQRVVEKRQLPTEKTSRTPLLCDKNAEYRAQRKPSASIAPPHASEQTVGLLAPHPEFIVLQGRRGLYWPALMSCAHVGTRPLRRAKTCLRRCGFRVPLKRRRFDAKKRLKAAALMENFQRIKQHRDKEERPGFGFTGANA